MNLEDLGGDRVQKLRAIPFSQRWRWQEIDGFAPTGIPEALVSYWS